MINMPYERNTREGKSGVFNDLWYYCCTVQSKIRFYALWFSAAVNSVFWTWKKLNSYKVLFIFIYLNMTRVSHSVNNPKWKPQSYINLGFISYHDLTTLTFSEKVKYLYTCLFNFYLVSTELVDKCIGSRIHIVMKNDKEIVGTLLGFDDFVSILLCIVCWMFVQLLRVWIK